MRMGGGDRQRQERAEDAADGTSGEQREH